MIRLSKKADYGIVLLSHFVGGEWIDAHSARDLAEISELPLPMVGKILKSLARAGILTSQRGVNGGYALAQDAAEITVGSVIQALDGPVALTDCGSGDAGDCWFRERCPVITPVQTLTAVVQQALESVTLRDLFGTRGQRTPAGALENT